MDLKLKFGVVLLTSTLFGMSQSAFAATALFPAPPPPPVGTPANCPEYLIGQVDGVYYYGTSNCDDVFGFGQSNANIPVPQCMGLNCGTPISIVRQPPELKVAAADPVPGWIAELEAKLAELQHARDSRPSTDGRRERLQRLIPFVQRTLNYMRLNETAAPLDEKTRAWQQYVENLAVHEHSIGRIGNAGEESLRFAIRDLQIAGAPKSATDTNFTPSGSYPSGVTVTSTKGQVLKVEVKTGEFRYFQTFIVSVSSSNSARRIDMRVGVEVTADGLTSTVDAEFSERGQFGHRIRTKAGRTPFLVNGFSDLEP